EFYSCIPIFKYTLAVFNDKEPLHHKSLMVLYQFLPPLSCFVSLNQYNSKKGRRYEITSSTLYLLF
ncbi:hypothetical protein FVP10_07010, partial [Staphylococcus aureus]